MADEVDGAFYGGVEGLAALEPEAIRDRVKRFLGTEDPSSLSYEEICASMSVAQYIADLCLRTLEETDRLTFIDGNPVIPHLIPEDMVVQTILNRGGSLQ